MIPSPADYSDFDPAFSTSWEKISFDVETTPRMYLDFAISDIEEEQSARNLVNSLSNAKRALHLQVETVSNSLGFKSYYGKKLPNFHDYLDFCKDCGIVKPRILRKLNKVRNAVEHDYKIKGSD